MSIFSGGPTIGNALMAAGGVPLGGIGLHTGGSPSGGGSDAQYVGRNLLQGNFDTNDPYGALYQQRARDAATNNDNAAMAQVQADWARYQAIQDDPELVKEWQARLAKGLPGLTDDEITTMRAQHAQTKLQGELAGRVNKYFDDPTRQFQQGKAADTMRSNALGDLAVQYTGAQTLEAQDAGRKGTQGGSYDIENRGTLDRANQATAAGIEGQAQDQYRGLRQRDQSMRTQLLAHIYSQNPGTSAAANANLNALLEQTRGANDLGAEQQTQLDISHFGNVLQSQAYGQALSGLAGAADTYARSGSSSGGGW